MKFENTRVYNFEGAFRGMRNPKNSWHLSDSGECFGKVCFYNEDCWNPNLNKEDCVFRNMIKEAGKENNGIIYTNAERNLSRWLNMQNIDHGYVIGPKDMRLAQTLIRSGSEHRKFLRQIFVCVDITAPLYWFKEFDTYKVGTVANSTSTMHKMLSKPITLDCFEIGDYSKQDFVEESLIPYLENLRQEAIKSKEVGDDAGYWKNWKELIRWLPESWLQTRTITLNYENLLAMCSKGQRRFHKLCEWSSDFINWARTLPYAQELIFIDEINDK